MKSEEKYNVQEPNPYCIWRTEFRNLKSQRTTSLQSDIKGGSVLHLNQIKKRRRCFVASITAENLGFFPGKFIPASTN